MQEIHVFLRIMFFHVSRFFCLCDAGFRTAGFRALLLLSLRTVLVCKFPDAGSDDIHDGQPQKAVPGTDSQEVSIRNTRNHREDRAEEEQSNHQLLLAGASQRLHQTVQVRLNHKHAHIA